MENQFTPSDLSISNITALSNVKEVAYTKKSKINIVVLIVMIVFTAFFVFLSVYKFSPTTTTVQKSQAVSSYNNQVQQMAK